MRISIILLICLFIAGCGSKQKQPFISGLLWGGEGSRLIVKQLNGKSGWSDTILINHLGEFEWTKDSIEPGFYRLENLSGQGLVFFLEKGSAVFVDGQSVNYPENAKIHGSDIAGEILEIEKNTREWLNEINKISNRTKSLYWIPSDVNKQKLRLELDSLRKVYCHKAITQSDKPLVRFVAMMQFAGNNNLFDTWIDRKEFFYTDSVLEPFKKYKVIEQFGKKVDTLRYLHALNEKVSPGTKFPEISFPNQWGDSIAVSKLFKTSVYLEVWSPGMGRIDKIHSSVFPVLNKYKRSDLEVYLIALDTATTIWKERIRARQLYFTFTNVIDTRGLNSPIMNELGLLQLPANFLIGPDGIVVAKNIWGNQLEKGIDLLLKK